MAALVVASTLACSDEFAMRLQPPDSSPRWLEDDSSYFADFPVAKSAIEVRFRDGTTLAERKAALDLIGGAVVGGTRFEPAEGSYIIRIPISDRDGLERALSALERLPYVEVASEIMRAVPAST